VEGERQECEIPGRRYLLDVTRDDRAFRRKYLLTT